MDRRGFLRATGALGGAALLGNAAAACVPVPAHSSGGIGAEYFPTTVPGGSILDLGPSEAPIDHVVVLMMENRSFHLYPASMSNPWRGCGFEDPGHGWDAGHAQRDRGFLGEGSNNDRYALGYY